MHPIQPTRRKQRLAACIACLTIVGATSGCATGPNRNPADPLEPLNRVTFRINDSLDRHIMKPVARGYNRVVPSPIRTAIDNFFSNVGDFVSMLNNIVQLRFEDSVNMLTRVAFNSTFGFAGLLDIATPAGLVKHDQDFGLTLGHYGIPSGPYLVLPLFGPSTFRDTAGLTVDQFATPTNYLDVAWRNSLWITQIVSTRARYLSATNLLEEAALDKYLFVRDAYLGSRRYQLTGGQEEAPNYGQPQETPEIRRRR